MTTPAPTAAAPIDIAGYSEALDSDEMNYRLILRDQPLNQEAWELVLAPELERGQTYRGADLRDLAEAAVGSSHRLIRLKGSTDLTPARDAPSTTAQTPREKTSFFGRFASGKEGKLQASELWTLTKVVGFGLLVVVFLLGLLAVALPGVLDLLLVIGLMLALVHLARRASSWQAPAPAALRVSQAVFTAVWILWIPLRWWGQNANGTPGIIGLIVTGFFAAVIVAALTSLACWFFTPAEVRNPGRLWIAIPVGIFVLVMLLSGIMNHQHHPGYGNTPSAAPLSSVI